MPEDPRSWPHGPMRQSLGPGTYMVTAATYCKLPLFSGDVKLRLLEQVLLQAAERGGWQVEAWAVFANHYHWVGQSRREDPRLSQLVSYVHSATARQLNLMDDRPGRKVWFQYWDTHLTFEKSYLARLAYVHRNAERHGLAKSAADYPFCSAAWFEKRSEQAWYRTVMSFDVSRVNAPDDF